MIGLHANSDRIGARAVFESARGHAVASGMAGPEMMAGLRRIAYGEDYEDALQEEVFRLVSSIRPGRR